MDSTTLILPTYRGEIDEVGNIILWPTSNKAALSKETVPASGLDPVTVQLVEAALLNARLEMDALIQRVAMSPAMREQVQSSCFECFAS